MPNGLSSQDIRRFTPLLAHQYRLVQVLHVAVEVAVLYIPVGILVLVPVLVRVLNVPVRIDVDLVLVGVRVQRISMGYV